MSWVYLLIGIILDVAGTVFLKLSNGLSRTWATALMLVCYGASAVPLALATRQLEISLVYAAWSALGTALVAAVGVFLFDEPPTVTRLISFGLIIVGVVMLNLSTPTGPR
ncbi:MAG: multidrug efflux SMR transporter [Terriglobales bacterium]